MRLFINAVNYQTGASHPCFISRCLHVVAETEAKTLKYSKAEGKKHLNVDLDYRLSHMVTVWAPLVCTVLL